MTESIKTDVNECIESNMNTEETMNGDKKADIVIKINCKKYESGKKSAELNPISVKKTGRNWKIPQIFLLVVFAFSNGND